jgi:hypothetical protein
MKGTNMVEYVFEVTGKVIVKMHGLDTEINYYKAKEQAVRQALKEIDDDWIIDVAAEEFTDYEEAAL